MLMKKQIFSIMLSAFVIAAGIFIPGNAGSAKAATSYFSVSGLSAPTQLVTGQSFKLKGTIKSKTKTKMTSVTVGITSSEGKWITGGKASANPKATSYSISKLNSKIKFGSLSNGTYYYKITAKDKSGHSSTLNNSMFTVSTMYITGYSVPSNYYYGKSFTVKGKVQAANKLTSVKVGVTSSAGKYVSTYSKTKSPKSTSFNIATVDSSIKFGKIPAGTYYYKIWAKDSKGNSETLVNEKFTVSRFTTSSVNKPSSIIKGNSFSIRGKVKSTFKIKAIRIGAVNSKGKWMSGVNASASPKAKSYSVSKVDSKVKFGKLSTGTYKYRIAVTDVNGISKNIVNSTFKVKTESTGSTDSDNAEVSSGGKILSYSHTIFNEIGKQPYSGPCGGYAMAYGRLVKDGYFNADGWGSRKAKILDYYCDGRSYAYWDRADAYGVYYLDAPKKAAQVVLSEVSSGRPCIMAVCTTSSVNHYVTVIGYKAGTTYSNVNIYKFIILDPATGTQRNVSDTNYLDKSARGMDNQNVLFSN